MEFIDENTIKLDKEINELDRFVVDFCKVLEKHTKYMIISGYVSILFGRSRGTEDVDMFIKKVGEGKFELLFDELNKEGFQCINASKSDALESLKKDVPIRFARKESFIPNIEMKLVKRRLDMDSIEHPLKVILSEGELKISHIEPQIAFKEACLKSDKDMEDALHLRKVFEGKLDKEKIEYYKQEFSK